MKQVNKYLNDQVHEISADIIAKHATYTHDAGSYMFDLNALYFPFPMICGIWLMITLSKRQKQG